MSFLRNKKFLAEKVYKKQLKNIGAKCKMGHVALPREGVGLARQPPRPELKNHSTKCRVVFCCSKLFFYFVRIVIWASFV